MKTFLKYLAVFVVLLLLAVLIFLFRPTVSKKIQTSNNEPVVDAVLVGGGIMSATLGTYLTELEPNWQIRMYERL
ncbi:MAG: malate:quinone oxidoreductase, partial [Acinetobacter tandoii]